jgi:hypothetical protein
MYRHTDGSLLLYVSCAHDSTFAPFGRWRSTDGGSSWFDEEETVPSCQIAHSFADGTLFELDRHGFRDPAAADTYRYYGAWSVPGAGSLPRGHSAFDQAEDGTADWLGASDNLAERASRSFFTIVSPSAVPVPRMERGDGFPRFQWSALISGLYGGDADAAGVVAVAPMITDVLELPGKLLAAGYAQHIDDQGRYPGVRIPDTSFCYESRDRGESWTELSALARGTGETREGCNETALIQLEDGRLYAVIRTWDTLVHCWSEDEGKTWTRPEPIVLIDSGASLYRVWPRLARLQDGTLLLTYGRRGKHLVFDPTGTGNAWQGHLDLHDWELRSQEIMGVPADQRLRGDELNDNTVRYWNSGDYLAVVPTGPREMLVAYDVQSYVESWNALPVSAIRMVRVRLQ